MTMGVSVTTGVSVVTTSGLSVTSGSSLRARAGAGIILLLLGLREVPEYLRVAANPILCREALVFEARVYLLHDSPPDLGGGVAVDVHVFGLVEAGPDHADVIGCVAREPAVPVVGGGAGLARRWPDRRTRPRSRCRPETAPWSMAVMLVAVLDFIAT